MQFLFLFQVLKQFLFWMVKREHGIVCLTWDTCHAFRHVDSVCTEYLMSFPV